MERQRQQFLCEKRVYNKAGKTIFISSLQKYVQTILEDPNSFDCPENTLHDLIAEIKAIGGGLGGILFYRLISMFMTPRDPLIF